MRYRERQQPEVRVICPFSIGKRGFVNLSGYFYLWVDDTLTGLLKDATVCHLETTHFEKETQEKHLGTGASRSIGVLLSLTMGGREQQAGTLGQEREAYSWKPGLRKRQLPQRLPSPQSHPPFKGGLDRDESSKQTWSHVQSQSD